MITMKMMKRWDSSFLKLLSHVGVRSRLELWIETPTIDSSSKITVVANLFSSHRGHSFEGPLLTPASWKQWRKQPRTSATTWTPPKAWTPTKTRSITLQTEWPHLCDLLTSHVFTSRISGCRPAQTFSFPLLLLYLRLPHPGVASPSFFLLWDACKLPSSPAVCKVCWSQSVWAAVPFTFLKNVHSNNLHSLNYILKIYYFLNASF